jgi:hypothetical protein
MLALSALLVIALGAIVWQGRAFWNDAQAKRRSTVNVKVAPTPAPPLTPTPKPDAAAAIKYADVATKDLFSKDRNPTVVIEPLPKVEEKKMPPLPVVYGVLGLPSGTKALMSEKRGEPSRSVHTGDSIGEFKIASLNPQIVVFNWDGKQIMKKIDDLIDRSEAAGPAGGSAVAAQAGQAAAPPPPRANTPPPPATPGAQTGPTQRACVPGDASPAGTVADGYRKVVNQTPFGAMCNWVAQ